MATRSPQGLAFDALLLDADGVVQRTAPGWKARLRDLHPADPDGFLTELFAAERPCLAGNADFANVLQELLSRRGIATPVQDVLAFWTMIEADEAVLALVASLRKRGTVVALATNQQAHRAAHMQHTMAYAKHFDHSFYSCELGYTKPSAAFFHTIADALNVPHERILFVDDHDANVEGARQCGLQAHQYHLDQGVARLEQLLGLCT